MHPCLSGLDATEHNPLDGRLALLAEGAFREFCLDGDLGGSHQLVYWAAICHAVQFIALFVGEHYPAMHATALRWIAQELARSVG